MDDQVWVSEDSAPYLEPRAEGQADLWTASDRQRHTQRLVDVRETVPPPEVATALGIGENATAVVRRRIMYVGDTPVELTDSFYPATIAAGTPLAEPVKIKGGAVTLLTQLGHAVHEVIETVSASRIDNPGDYGLVTGDPVLVLTRVSLDARQRPIEVSVMHMLRGQRLTYRTQIG